MLSRHSSVAVLFAVVLSLTACGGSSRTLREILPSQVGGGWTLKGSESLPAEETPAAAQTLAVAGGVEATYTGNGGSIQVRLLDMKAETNAFEMVQKWRPSDGQALYRGQYFFVARSKDQEPSVVSGFLQEFQKAVH